MVGTRQEAEGGWAGRLAALGYRASREAAVDYTSGDGTFVVAVLERKRTAVRDLRAAFVQLASYLAHAPGRCGCVLLTVDRLTPKRLRREWDDLMAVLRPGIAERLALVAVGQNDHLILPRETAPLTALAEVGQRLVDAEAPPELPRLPRAWEVFKVLLARRLLGEGRIARGELGEQVGCSYPTVAKAVDRFAGYICEHSNRSVELESFPQGPWGELLALAPRGRARLRYADRSGRQPDPEALLKRLRRHRPPEVAVGGVVAARHWDPHFDLRGFPRLDVSVAGRAALDLSFVRRLDPALKPCDDQEPPVLVVHPLQRSASLFAAGEHLPVADPVEALLDLAELRLIDQSTAMIERLERRRTGSSR